MKNYIYFPALILTVILILSGCDTVDNKNSIQGSGNLISLDQNFADFTSIETSYAFESSIMRDTIYKITVTLDDNLSEYLKVIKEGSVLKVFMDEDFDYRDATLKVDIALPDIERITLSGASASVISGFNFTHDLKIILSGASTVSGTIYTGNLILEAAGASNVSFTGTGENLIVNCSGASVLSLGNYYLNGNASLVLSGASVSTVRLNGTLNATLSGASVLRYYGSPTLGAIITTGESIIIKL